MKRWGKALKNYTCGGPHAEPRRIRVGDPVLQVQIGTLRKVRCIECAGPPPPDLPERPRLFERDELTAQVDNFEQIGRISRRNVLDWKQKAIGE